MMTTNRDEVLKTELLDHINNGCLDHRCELTSGENLQVGESFIDHIVEVINDIYDDDE